ncbi:MAG: zf-HC2 domain-containing protein [Pseudomonadota bacterium]
MTCSNTNDLIEQFVDGECTADEADAVREHLLTCVDCRTRTAQLSQLQERIHQDLSRVRAPADLWPRIHQRMASGAPAPTETTVLSSSRRDSKGIRLRRFAIAASLAAITLAGAAGLALWPRAASHAVVQVPVNDFATYRLSERAPDFESRDPRAIAAWLNGKVDFVLPPFKDEVAGYELIGSRLCWLLERRLSALTYARGDDLVSLYIMPADDIDLPETVYDPALQSQRSAHRIGEHRSLIWAEDGLVYALVSDLPERTLVAFASAWRGAASVARPTPVFFAEGAPTLPGGADHG